MDFKLILVVVVALVSIENARSFSVPTINRLNVNLSVNLRLFTRENPNRAETLTPGRSNALMRRRINMPIKIVIHGWMESGNTGTVTSLTEQFLKQVDVNVIAVDWVMGSRNPNYFMAAANTRPVGEHVGALINHLISEGADPYNIHIVGHSLGGHVAGFAGAAVTGGKRLARITGLDPALPGFDGVPITDRLDTSDAQFVDIIHTSGGLYGIEEPVGHADFYPNGGRHRQPGCVPAGMCSHMRAVDFFVESIDRTHRFQALICDAVPTRGPEGCRFSPHDMGYHLNSTARGIFYSQTNPRQPYAMEIRQ